MARRHEAEQTPDEATDEQLASRAHGGDTAAFETLVTRFRPRLVHFLWGKVRNLADAEDVAQETLTRAFEKLERFDANQRFSTWLFTIAARLAIDHARRRGRDKATATLSDAPPLPSNGHRPNDRVAEAEWRDNLWATAANVLTEEQYTGLWLQYGEQFELKQIAEVLGRKPVHMRVILMRARRQLAGHLNQDGTLARIGQPEAPAQDKTAGAHEAAPTPPPQASPQPGG